VDFNTYLKDGTAVKNYRSMVVKLLRLRQLTAHPFLLRESNLAYPIVPGLTHSIEQTIQTILTLDDVRKLEAKLNEVQQMDKRPLYEKVGQWIRDHTKERQKDGNEGNDEHEPEDGDSAFGRSSFGSNFTLAKYLQTLDEREMLTCCIYSLYYVVLTVS
jgi:hypothetical protein